MDERRSQEDRSERTLTTSSPSPVSCFDCDLDVSTHAKFPRTFEAVLEGEKIKVIRGGERRTPMRLMERRAGVGPARVPARPGPARSGFCQATRLLAPLRL